MIYFFFWNIINSSNNIHKLYVKAEAVEMHEDAPSDALKMPQRRSKATPEMPL